MADVCNQSDCIVKKPLSEMEGMQEKESIMGVRDRQKNLSLGILVWRHLASLLMPGSNPLDGFFYRTLTPMVDTCNLELDDADQNTFFCCFHEKRFSSHIGTLQVVLAISFKRSLHQFVVSSFYSICKLSCNTDTLDFD